MLAAPAETMRSGANLLALATVGIKHAGLAPNLTVGVKTTTDALHVVAVR